MIFSTSKPLLFDDCFTSGKYAGEKVCGVMAKDIGYLWFMERSGIRFGDRVTRCLRSIKKNNHKWTNKK